MRFDSSYLLVKGHAGFSDVELDRSRRFNRPLHAALLLDLALSLATLAALTQLHVGLPWYLAALVLPVLVELVPGVVRLPSGHGVTATRSAGSSRRSRGPRGRPTARRRSRSAPS